MQLARYTIAIMIIILMASVSGQSVQSFNTLNEANSFLDVQYANYAVFIVDDVEILRNEAVARYTPFNFEEPVEVFNRICWDQPVIVNDVAYSLKELREMGSTFGGTDLRIPGLCMHTQQSQTDQQIMEEIKNPAFQLRLVNALKLHFFYYEPWLFEGPMPVYEAVVDNRAGVSN